MSWIGRFANQFRQRRLTKDIDDELQAHIEEAVRRGRSGAEARRAFGSALRLREHSREVKLLPWLDALASDAVFGWRQINKNRTASVAAILSLALAMGATCAAFRLVDAVLLRKLPVANPDRLFLVATSSVPTAQGQPAYRDDFDYPTFREYSHALGDAADSMVLGETARKDVRFGAGGETETVYRQYYSGNVFGVFGLHAAMGRLLTPDDDKIPGANPLAVISHGYWTRRFGRDPDAVGKTFLMDDVRYQIIGVAPRGFTGTEPGFVTDVFVPATMNTQALNSPGWSWFRMWVRPKAGVTPEQIRQPLQAVLTRAIKARIETLSADTPRQGIDALLSQKILVFPAASGASNFKMVYRQPLIILGTLVTLVLLIACANVGNLLTAQAASRAREMALRVSIGAGKLRLIQLMLVEGALLAFFAATAGALFAWRAAPLIVSMLAPPKDPVQLVMDADSRALGFGAGLTVLVTILFGLAPAIRASAVQPVSALKGGEDPRARRRLMNTLIAAQMAFCVLVLFLAGLFATSFERLSNLPLGFSKERILLLDTGLPGQRPATIWSPMLDHLRQMAGVESVSVSGWPLMSGNGWVGTVKAPGHPIEARSPYFLDVSPGFFETMRIGMLGGRDFRWGEVPPHLEGNGRAVAGVGIVNEAFARTYFDGGNPVGRVVEVRQGKDVSAAMEIVGYVRDAGYRYVREPVRPTVYVPLGNRAGANVVVRTAGDPLAMAPGLRREISQAGSGLQVLDIDTQRSLVDRQMLRDRLLATLSLFFSIVAIVLAGIGLYGVLNYSVIQQWRELGIRLALGARWAHVVGRVAANTLGMVCLGSAIGLGAGLGCERFVEALLFQVKAGDPGSIAPPILILLAAAIMAALPPAIRAVRIDPARALRGD